MKAIVLHEYGGPEKLKWEDRDDPTVGEGEVLVRVTAASINPVDWKMRSGEAKAMFPVEFPGVLGRDLSGIVRAVGPGVSGFEPGDRVFALSLHTYAELCVVNAAELARVPEELDLVEASALPLVTLTGEQLVRLGTGIEAGQTILITGANGGVGRSAVWAARAAGAYVIAGVRKSQMREAESLKADRVVALDDGDALAELGFVHAVADAVGGATAEKLLAKITPGGVFASVLGPPKNAAMHPTVRIVPVVAAADPVRMLQMATEVAKGSFVIPIDRMIAMEDAADGHTAAQKGGLAKILLLA